MSRISVPVIAVLLCVVGCSAPSYLTVPPAEVTNAQYRGLSPSLPAQATVQDQHLAQLQVAMRELEERLLRAEQTRLEACRDPEATQVHSVAYQRCQLKDLLYQQLTVEAALARSRFLRAVSGHGGMGR